MIPKAWQMEKSSLLRDNLERRKNCTTGTSRPLRTKSILPHLVNFWSRREDQSSWHSSNKSSFLVRMTWLVQITQLVHSMKERHNLKCCKCSMTSTHSRFRVLRLENHMVRSIYSNLQESFLDLRMMRPLWNATSLCNLEQIKTSSLDLFN